MKPIVTSKQQRSNRDVKRQTQSRKGGNDLPPEIKERLYLLQGRIEPQGSAKYIWNALTSKEQKSLGDDVTKAFKAFGGTLGMLQHAWNCSGVAALIKIYERLGSVPRFELTRLKRALGLPADIPTESKDKPVWTPVTGELIFRGEVARRCRRKSVAKNIILILAAFQEVGWPHHIDDPLPGGRDPQRLRETVRTLNCGLRFIEFAADGSGEGILWRET